MMAIFFYIYYQDEHVPHNTQSMPSLRNYLHHPYHLKIEIYKPLHQLSFISEEQKKHILYAVEHHEEYAFGAGVSVSDIESKIVQDADNLDAIGAMGISRAIRYCVAKNLPDYIKEVELYRNEYTEAKEDISAVHHIHNKLLRLGDYMNTDTAKEIAKKRNKIMEDFRDAYIEEINGIL